MQFVDHDVVQEGKICFLSLYMRVLVVCSSHRLRQNAHYALVERANQLIHDVRNLSLVPCKLSRCRLDK